MFTQLEKANINHLLPLLDGIPRDPMMYMVLEGNRTGRIYVDQPSNPSVAFIWTGMEYAYLIGDSDSARTEVVQVIEWEILPTLEVAGLEFVTIFPSGVSPAAIQAWFPKRKPVSFGVNAFSFDPNSYRRWKI